MKEEYIPAPSRNAVRVGRPDAANAHHPHIDQRLSAASVDNHPGGAEEQPGDDQLECPCRAPAPDGRLADREQKGRDAAAHQHGREPVDLARDAHRRFGHEPAGADGSHDDRHERHPEQPLPAQVLDNHAAGDDADAGPDPEDRREKADASGDLLARKLIPHDPEGEREDPAGHTLNHASGDQQRQRMRERRQQRPAGEDDERPDEHMLLAVHVAEAAEDRRPDRGRQQVAGQQPGDAGLRGVEAVLARQQRRHDR
jgi:hypothetical protein